MRGAHPRGRERPRGVVEALRAAGHDVEWIASSKPGAADADLVTLATQARRLLLTFDKDFGELAVRRGRAPPAGVALVRLPASATAEVAARLTDVFARHTIWAGHLAIIEPDRTRVRSL